MRRAKWAGRKVTTARAFWAARLPLPCWRCGRTLTADSDWTVGHLQDRMDGGPETRANEWPECALCNYSAGGRRGARITNARKDVSDRRGVMVPERERGIRGW